MNSLFAFLFILLGFSLSANNCDSKIPMEKIINTYWQHSHEDDRGDTMAFRPKHYDFPRSRGREGFEFRENGVFIKYAIAPTDGIAKIYGSWQRIDDTNTFFIQLNDNSEFDYPLPVEYKLHILEYDDKKKLLKVKNH